MMRVPARANPQRQSKYNSASIPAPTLGLNARDELAEMDPRHAIILTNGFPDADRVAMRRGYVNHALAMTDPVQSVMVWRGPTSDEVLTATADTLWTATGAGTASSAATGLTSGLWQHLNFTTSAGHYLVMVNGADTPRKYDGSSVTTTTFTGTGLTATNLINIASHKQRIWLVEKDTQNAWYAATDAIAGALTKFPLGAVFKDGGYLTAIGTYSDDAGDGIDDYAVFISSTGEILLYQGTDPSSANTWGLVGRYKTGAPLGRRCMTNLGGDLLILTESGVQSIKAVIKYDRAQQEFASVSNKIDPLIVSAAREYKANTGWQILVYPRAKWLVVNVPVSDGVSQYQYVMNTVTGAWCKFDGFDANAFGCTDTKIWFGGNDGILNECDINYDDNGSKIDMDIKTSFNYFNSRGTEKHFKMIRPVFSSTGRPTITIGASVDFGEEEPSGDLTPSAIGTATWDNAVWDDDVWGGLSLVTKRWTNLNKIGMCMATMLRVSIRGGACSLNSFDIVAETGAVL